MQWCFETQRATTHSAAVAGDSNAQQCTATRRAAQRSVCVNGILPTLSGNDSIKRHRQKVYL